MAVEATIKRLGSRSVTADDTRGWKVDGENHGSDV